MKTMSSFFAGALALSQLLAVNIRAQAFDAAAFWSFQTTLNPTNTADGKGSFTSEVTATTGFPTTPTFSFVGSSLNNNGGALSFTAFDGSTWTGGGQGSQPGWSVGWNGGSTGNSFTVTLDTAGLSSLQVRMDIRSYTGGLTSFSDLQYDIGAGWVSSGLLLASVSTDSGHHPWSMDLSSLAAINDQSSVALRWLIADVPEGTSFRIDNLQITAVAVPEPAYPGLVLSVVAMGTIALCRRARRQM
ncbi:MAG: hypothetical protein LBK99_07325 [Opitutaceae bacterium]|jgi:hypothetical protein|nr:hypothetical protein [Opitutaceae bacterium]